MHHFFVRNKPDENGIIKADNEALHHMRVLRIKPGEKVTVSDGHGSDFCCAVEAADKSGILLKVESKCPSSELPVCVTLYQGIPKSDKLELIIQKAVELGVSRIVPVKMKRCVSVPDKSRMVSKLARFNQISEAAAKQSRRSIIPTVETAMTIEEVIKDAKGGRLIVPYESAEGMNKLNQILKGGKVLQRTGILIGPEGGFAPEEIEICKAKGADIISLGKRILRTETAALAIMSALMLAMEMENDA